MKGKGQTMNRLSVLYSRRECSSNYGLDFFLLKLFSFLQIAHCIGGRKREKGFASWWAGKDVHLSLYLKNQQTLERSGLRKEINNLWDYFPSSLCLLKMEICHEQQNKCTEKSRRMESQILRRNAASWQFRPCAKASRQACKSITMHLFLILSFTWERRQRATLHEWDMKLDKIRGEIQGKTSGEWLF